MNRKQVVIDAIGSLDYVDYLVNGSVKDSDPGDKVIEVPLNVDGVRLLRKAKAQLETLRAKLWKA